MKRLPWIEALLPPLLHIPMTGILALVSGVNPFAALVWQLFAWPTLAGLCFVTFFPILWVLDRYTGLKSVAIPASRLLGCALSGLASYSFFEAEKFPWGVEASWVAALCGAICFYVSNAGKNASCEP